MRKGKRIFVRLNPDTHLLHEMTANKPFNRRAQERRSWVPAALRAAAPVNGGVRAQDNDSASTVRQSQIRRVGPFNFGR